MGVVTITDIDYGLIFGPFPSHITATDPAYVIGMLTNDRRPEGVMLQVDTSEPREGGHALDWLPYVSPARDEEEQNVEAYRKGPGVYYRTLRIVKAGEELLVWYSKDFTQSLGVPELQTNSKRDDEQFICSHCGEMFDYPYPLRAHLKFKCSFTIEDVPYRRTPISRTSLGADDMYTPNTHRKFVDYLQEKPSHALNYMTNNNSIFTISSKRCLDSIPSKLPAKKIKTEEFIPKKDSSITHSIAELSKSHVSRNTDDVIREHVLEPYAENGSAFTKVEKLGSPDSKTPPRSSPLGFLSTSKLSSSHSSQKSSSSPPADDVAISTCSTMPGPHTLPVHKLHSSSSLLHHGQSTSSLGEPSTTSMPPPPPPPLCRPSPSSSSFSPPSSSSSSSSSSPSRLSSMKSLPPSSASVSRPVEPSLTSAPIMGLYMPRIPLIPPPSPLGMPAGSMLGTARGMGRLLPLPHSAFRDQIPPGLLEMCRATIPSVGPLTESFAANIGSNEIHERLAKQALFADQHISSLAFLKSSNPMVEKLLQSTNPTVLSSPVNALNLSQNWCAKCNATFRMTSDLVYHMRSHHKREFDPIKRKREEKLKCAICSESFRERHHLTRHMSSHA